MLALHNLLATATRVAHTNGSYRIFHDEYERLSLNRGRRAPTPKTSTENEEPDPPTSDGTGRHPADSRGPTPSHHPASSHSPPEPPAGSAPLNRGTRRPRRQAQSGSARCRRSWNHPGRAPNPGRDKPANLVLACAEAAPGSTPQMHQASASRGSRRRRAPSSRRRSPSDHATPRNVQILARTSGNPQQETCKPQGMQAVEPTSLGAETCSTTCKSPEMETAGIEPASAIA